MRDSGSRVSINLNEASFEVLTLEHLLCSFQLETRNLNPKGPDGCSCRMRDEKALGIGPLWALAHLRKVCSYTRFTRLLL